MAHFDCLVDTEPMANQINSVSSHIQHTTAAVVGMKAAVVAAENAAAEQVCSQVNKGFYTLIHSQISQKIAKLQSEVDSHLMKLNQLRKQLTGIKGRMERDYGMISSRYIKLFQNLNKNLYQRVYELDKPAMEFVMKDISTISNRKKMMTATVPVSQQESLAVSQRIIASNIKFQGNRVIESMTRFLAQAEAQKQLTDQVLLSQSFEQTRTSYMVPFILCESNYDRSEAVRRDIYTTSSLADSSVRRILNTVEQASVQLEWEDGHADKEVASEFQKCLAASASSERVKAMTEKLFAAHIYQTLKPKAL